MLTPRSARPGGGLLRAAATSSLSRHRGGKCPLMSQNLRAASRWVTWVCIGVLAIFSWTPGSTIDVVRTSAPGQIEHFIAYFGTGSLATFGYGRRFSYILIAVLLTMYAGILEVGQTWVPWRHPQLIDFLASSSAAIVGALAVYLWNRK